MITLRFGPAALAHVRFAISPLIEARRSLRVLDDPGRGALHLPWAIEARRLTAGPRPLAAAGAGARRRLHAGLRLASAHQPAGRVRGRARRVVAATPPEQALAEVQRSYRRKPSHAGGARALRRGPGRRRCGGRRPAARLLGSRAGAALAARARAAGGRRAASRAPDGRRRRRATLRRRRSDRQLGRRHPEHRQAGAAGRRPRGARAALRPQRVHVAGRRPRHRSASGSRRSSIRRAGSARCGSAGRPAAPDALGALLGKAAGRPC